MCFCFISCGKNNDMNIIDEETMMSTKEYTVVLDDVYEVLELSEMDEFIKRYGEDGYSDLFSDYMKDNIYLDKYNFTVAYMEDAGIKQNSVQLTDIICTEELMQEFVEQFEHHYSIKMKSNEYWEDGSYVYQFLCKQKEILYYVAFMTYEREKTIYLGTLRGNDEILEEEYRRLSK